VLRKHVAAGSNPWWLQREMYEAKFFISISSDHGNVTEIYEKTFIKIINIYKKNL
jgi:hypothetical protein